jgi:hypothetical protein
LRGVAKAAVIASMSTKKREVIFGGRIMGAIIRAEHARRGFTLMRSAKTRCAGWASC